jgi:hypothetical protein
VSDTAVFRRPRANPAASRGAASPRTRVSCTIRPPCRLGRVPAAAVAHGAVGALIRAPLETGIPRDAPSPQEKGAQRDALLSQRGCAQVDSTPRVDLQPVRPRPIDAHDATPATCKPANRTASPAGLCERTARHTRHTDPAGAATHHQTRRTPPNTAPRGDGGQLRYGMKREGKISPDRVVRRSALKNGCGLEA